jgi:hypothetical protein
LGGSAKFGGQFRKRWCHPIGPEPHHNVTLELSRLNQISSDSSHLAAQPIADHGVSTLCGNDNSHPIVIGWESVNDDVLADVLRATPNNLTEIAWLNNPIVASEHQRELNRDFAAALAAASGQTRAACTSPHTQTETVNLRAAAVVGLVSTLRHEFSSASSRNGQGD